MLLFLRCKVIEYNCERKIIQSLFLTISELGFTPIGGQTSLSKVLLPPTRFILRRFVPQDETEL